MTDSTQPKTVVTVGMIRDIVAAMKERAIRPRVIKTKAEAKRATKLDTLVFGSDHAHAWSVGDEYYQIEAHENSLYARAIRGEEGND